MKKALLILAVVVLTGCSALGAVSNLLPTSKGVEATAQVGATNTKQGLGLTANTDASSEAKAEVKDSNVGSLDSSSGKKLSASSISANMIKADTIQVVSNDSGGINWTLLAFIGLLCIAAGALIGHYVIESKKGA